MRDDAAESRCRVFDISMQGAVVADDIGVGGNQLPRDGDDLDNGLSNSKVRKVPWVHGHVLSPPIPTIAVVLVQTTPKGSHTSHFTGQPTSHRGEWRRPGTSRAIIELPAKACSARRGRWLARADPGERLIGTCLDPGLRRLALAVLLEALDQVAKPTAQHTPHTRTAEEPAQFAEHAALNALLIDLVRPSAIAVLRLMTKVRRSETSSGIVRLSAVSAAGLAAWPAALKADQPPLGPQSRSIPSRRSMKMVRICVAGRSTPPVSRRGH